VNTFGKIVIAFLLLFAVLHITFTGKEQATRVFRLRDGKIITFEQMIGDLNKTNIILVGELHDDQFHHRLELAVIKALQDSGAPLAVGFEMFTAESQDDLNRWVNGRLPVDDFMKIYYRNWGMPWPLYSGILLYMRDHKIPAVGLNIPPEISEKVASSGFSALSLKELGTLPPGISCTVNERYITFIQRAYRSHSENDKFLHFCEAQILWDKAMAWNVIEFLKRDRSRTVVVVAGTGHSWKRGIPDQIRDLSKKLSYKVILPEVPDEIEPNNMTIDDADYILLRE